MNRYTVYLACSLFLIVHAYGIPQSPKSVLAEEEGLSQISHPAVYFRENIGQVRSQDGVSRPEVLFSGQTGGLVYHLTASGIHYQLYKGASLDAAKTLPTRGNNQELNLNHKVTLYRVDVDWLDANPHAEIITGDPLPGYEHFYNVPEGVEPALFVKRYASITYRNVYDGIDLRYYASEDGYLEYDFIVHPGADYRQIAMEVKGAPLSVNANNELVLKTPLGEIREGALKVYQDEQEVSAQWKVNSTEVRFQVDDYNPARLLRIDPPVRIWGSYYGGGGSDVGYGCATNGSNVYVAGYTESLSTIATLGAHQTSLSGSNDALLAKLDSNGIRLWATYFGGTASEIAYDCATDGNGHIYLAGFAVSTSNIATAGSHQPSNGGGIDAFLAKFDANGTRIWGTYYGGSLNDIGYSCAVDASGNVFLVGEAFSTSSITTGGSHQQSIGGDKDAFIAKFNSNGARQWGTYLGGSGSDYGWAAATDGSGNVVVVGQTASTSDIASPGAHQPVHAGNIESYIAKFDGSGNQLWSTYYGGSGNDYGWGCATDGAGNIFYVGQTTSFSAIATAGTHQPTIGGNTDGFLVKFDPSGTRLWGSYYGGSGIDIIKGCETDGSGNVFICGNTNSSSGIATSGAHQTVHAGIEDGLLAMFDNSGVQNWGTYYGDIGMDFFTSVAPISANEIFAAGYTTSTSATVIATNGTHQPAHGGSMNDAFVVKFSIAELLPVTWLDVQATALDDFIRIAWSTASEPDNYGFEVQRSTDNQNFEQIAWVESWGNNGATHHYSFEDAMALPGIRYYYRLKQVDYGGETSYSKVVTAIIRSDVLSVTIFPNPADGDMQVVVGMGHEQEVGITVYDQLGKLVLRESKKLPQRPSSFTLSTAQLQAGIYLATFQIGTETFQQRIVKVGR